MHRNGLIFIVISTMLLFSLNTSATETMDTFIDFQTGISDGSTTISGFNLAASGMQGQIRFGWKISRFLKLSLLGLYENLNIRYSATTLGTLDMLGYGGAARVFFMPKIFVEGMGGQTKATLRNLEGSAESVGYGSFYTIGSGIEWVLTREISIEGGVAIRNVIFPKNEFENTRSLFFSGGLSVYF